MKVILNRHWNKHY